MVCHFNSQLKIFIRKHNEKAVCSPLYIHSFQLFQSRKFSDAEKFNFTYSDPSQLITTADRLKYYRCKSLLLQRDIASYAKIDLSTYKTYEQTGRDYYPIESLKKIAELLRVDIIDLLDDYNLFLYNGQGQQIRELRESMKLKQCEFAKLYDVNRKTVERWESNQVQIFKSTWEKLFKSSDLKFKN